MSKTMVKAAVLQIKGDKGLEGNLNACAGYLQEAADAGAQLAVLPENFAYYGERQLGRVGAEENTSSGPARRFLAEMAQSLGLWLVGGTIPVCDTPGDKPFAACFLVSPEGEETARYNKIHLFDVNVAETGRRYCESDDYQPGGLVVVADTPWGRIGLSVCYDLRFPELYRAMSAQGARILVAPSAFTSTTGKAHWELLLRARAVENLSFMLGADLCDREHPQKPTWGGSAIIDPWGRVLASMSGEEGVVLAELEFAAQDTMRANLPALGHRRL